MPNELRELPNDQRCGRCWSALIEHRTLPNGRLMAVCAGCGNDRPDISDKYVYRVDVLTDLERRERGVEP